MGEKHHNISHVLVKGRRHGHPLSRGRLPGKFVLPLGLEICLLVSYFRKMWENAVDEVIDAAILVLNEELREIVRGKRKKRGRKCRNRIARRESLGTSNCLFRELSSEDPQEYKKHMRMNVEKFDELLRLVKSYISKTDTVMKVAILEILKLEVTLRFLVSGDSFSSLTYSLEFHHVPFQDFCPKHCNQLFFRKISALLDHASLG